MVKDFTRWENGRYVTYRYVKPIKCLQECKCTCPKPLVAIIVVVIFGGVGIGELYETKFESLADTPQYRSCPLFVSNVRNVTVIKEHRERITEMNSTGFNVTTWNTTWYNATDYRIDTARKVCTTVAYVYAPVFGFLPILLLYFGCCIRGKSTEDLDDDKKIRLTKTKRRFFAVAILAQIIAAVLISSGFVFSCLQIKKSPSVQSCKAFFGDWYYKKLIVSTSFAWINAVIILPFLYREFFQELV